MPTFTAENREAWQSLINDVGSDAPRPGRHVTIEGGRKHKGRSGIVLRHQTDQYWTGHRYESAAQATLRQAMGRHGYIILVEPDEGGEPFWVKADYAKVTA